MAPDTDHGLAVARLRHERAAREALLRQLDGLRAQKVRSCGDLVLGRVQTERMPMHGVPPHNCTHLRFAQLQAWIIQQIRTSP